MKRVFLFLLMAGFTSALWGQTEPQGGLSPTELAEISARGRALAGYDAAAWHASDALTPLNPANGSVQLYVARQMESGWVVVWGRFNEDKSKFLIVYEAKQSGGPTEYAVKKHDPPNEDTDFYLRAARAHEVAVAEFANDLKPQRPYNISVLPAASGSWYVFAIPAQTDAGVLPYGGDMRYTISADGTKVVEKHRMHQTVLEERIGPDTVLGFHTHVLSEVPEDSDVFYAMTFKTSEGYWIVTKKNVYTISADGAITYSGKPEEFVKLLKDGKPKELPKLQNAMMLASVQRLLSGDPGSDQLEAFASLAGARCEENTLSIKLSILVHNVSDKRIVLYKDTLQNAQARFARTAADLAAEKNYEKLVFLTGEIPDFSNNRMFIVLGPGMYYTDEREYPVLGANLKGKGFAQFLFIAWPAAVDPAQKEVQRARWAQTASLYTEWIDSDVFPIPLDPELLTRCGMK